MTTTTCCPPTKLRTQSRYLLDHPATGCVLGRQEWIVEDGVDVPKLKRDSIYGELGGIQLVSAMIRRHILEEVDGFDPSYRYAEDRDLFIRLREHGVEIAVLPDVVLHKRLHGANMTAESSGDASDAPIDAREARARRGAVAEARADGDPTSSASSPSRSPSTMARPISRRRSRASSHRATARSS